MKAFSMLGFSFVALDTFSLSSFFSIPSHPIPSFLCDPPSHLYIYSQLPRHQKKKMAYHGPPNIDAFIAQADLTLRNSQLFSNYKAGLKGMKNT